MSYEIIKSITFDEKNQTIRLCSASNNITPKYYDPWYPVAAGYDYQEWKRMFARSLFGGEAQFQPSCKSKAKKAYDKTNAKLGLSDTDWGVWHIAEKMYPHRYDYKNKCWMTHEDEEMKARYDEFQEKWIQMYLIELNWLLMGRK